jgi:hypothetical protein
MPIVKIAIMLIILKINPEGRCIFLSNTDKIMPQGPENSHIVGTIYFSLFCEALCVYGHKNDCSSSNLAGQRRTFAQRFRTFAYAHQAKMFRIYEKEKRTRNFEL